MTRWIAAAALATVADPSFAAQMRDGQPPTLAAPAPAADASHAVISRFRAAYARARAPRIVIFWNREFDDEVASSYQERRTQHEVETEDANGLEETSDGPAGSAKRSESGRIRERRMEDVFGTERVVSKRAQFGSETVGSQMEDAFTGTLANGGAILVDRRLATRLAGIETGAGERANVQAVEAHGVTSRADILVEILQSRDPRAPSGLAFRVSARDLRTARPLISMLTAGRPPQRAMPYVAGTQGFVRAQPPEPNASEIGAQLAIDLMARLGGVL